MSILATARKLRSIIERAAQSLDDSTALDAVSLYPKWEHDISYEVGTRVRYNDTLYTVVTAHDSQPNWTPDIAPSLFAKVLIPDENVVPEWQQPDSTNSYKNGDKVLHNGKTWISDVDNNVWEPGVYGWSEVTA